MIAWQPDDGDLICFAGKRKRLKGDAFRIKRIGSSLSVILWRGTSF
jgi:hypothetical protein